MRRSNTLKTTAFAALVGLIGAVMDSQLAAATEPCSQSCHYVSVIKYVDREVAYTKFIVLYDHCGQPYKVAKTCYETVSVPVRVRVLACD